MTLWSAGRVYVGDAFQMSRRRWVDNMTVVADQLAESRVAITGVFRSPALRRINLALVGSVIGDWAFSVAFAVYVYQNGGATALGVISVVRYVTMAVLASILSVLADKVDRRKLMITADVIRAVLVFACAAIILAEGPAMPVYVFSVLVGVVGLTFRPAQAALLPSLARNPSELTAANVASSTINSLGFFAGPMVAGLLLAVADVGAVFAFDALTFVWSAVMVFGVRPTNVVIETTHDIESLTEVDASTDDIEQAEPAEPVAGMFSGVADGYRVILGDRDLRLIVALYVAQTIVAGCSAVYEVTIALDLLEMAESGVGVLNAALGVGGLIGSVVALMLSQRGKLSRDFGLGVALWAAPLLLVAAFASIPSALLAMVLIGVGNSMVDVNAETIVQRLVPDDVLGRVFGALDSAAIAGMAIGAAIMPVMIATIGLRAGLVVIGVAVTLLVVLTIPGLVRVDKTALVPEGLDLLRGVPMLAVLPEHVIERLARTSERVMVLAGSPVFAAGDHGDRFYVIESGVARVSKFGQPVADLDVGESFGEIALLRDVPRTATVTAVTDLTARAIDRRHFLTAVTGHADASQQAELVVGRFTDMS
jgi:MFS family permease